MCAKKRITVPANVPETAGEPNEGIVSSGRVLPATEMAEERILGCGTQVTRVGPYMGIVKSPSTRT